MIHKICLSYVIQTANALVYDASWQRQKIEKIFSQARVSLFPPLSHPKKMDVFKSYLLLIIFHTNSAVRKPLLLISIFAPHLSAHNFIQQVHQTTNTGKMVRDLLGSA